MGTRTYTFSIPLPSDTTFNLLVRAGEQLPESSELAGTKFGRWEISLEDAESGLLEWKMYDHSIPTTKINIKLECEASEQTKATFKVTLLAQIFDPLGAYKENLHLILDPFMDLVKQEITKNNKSL
jgi:hypothetical protein